MKEAHIFISGFVQGVGFRRFVQKSARKNNVGGWIKNAIDNTVEAVLIGEKENIEKIIADCRKGPFLSEVKDVGVIWEDSGTGIEDFLDFRIIK